MPRAPSRKKGVPASLTCPTWQGPEGASDSPGSQLWRDEKGDELCWGQPEASRTSRGLHTGREIAGAKFGWGRGLSRQPRGLRRPAGQPWAELQLL